MEYSGTNINFDLEMRHFFFVLFSNKSKKQMGLKEVKKNTLENVS